jgi:hypothetical protein
VGFVYFEAFEMFQNMELRVNTREGYRTYMGKIGVCGGIDEVIAAREIYKMSVSIHFVSRSKITEPLSIIVDRSVAERNEEGSNNSDASLKGKKKARYTCV